ncbi:XapX domain-containing protein [Halegenticoccus tardaugens]|uniref:XapX domain-containing protein n=1 Tax=Halegenticoccus tardaugens TaxID=2071624 RepID=UPI00100ABDE3|nr:DUF1427 family protein [Halegenticoccus tardaugens]
MDTKIVVIAFCTGVFTGALFKFLHIPVPAPPELAGVMGIVGIYVGFQIMEWFGTGFDLLDALGI